MFRETIYKLKKTPVIFALSIVKFYRYCVSPLLKQRCRFIPTCSEYAEISIIRFGVIRGSFMTAKRLIRCHPFCKGGIDFVPEKKR